MITFGACFIIFVNIIFLKSYLLLSYYFFNIFQKILSKIYCTLNMTSAAEFCLRQLIVMGMQRKHFCYDNVWMQTALLGIKAYQVSNNTQWLDSSKAILNKVGCFFGLSFFMILRDDWTKHEGIKQSLKNNH